MPTLFRREWTVTLDNLDVSDLDIEFKIASSIKSEPNKCALTVWNMNLDHRTAFLKRNNPGKKAGVAVQVEAGYVNNTSVLFSGDLREVASQRDGMDWKTVLNGEDGGRAWREARIVQQFTSGTPISTVLRQCASAMGVGLGNVADFDSFAQITGIGSTLPHTMVCDGSAKTQLDRVMKSIGLVWSIQKGALQVQRKGKPLNSSSLKITASTGLVGSPESSVDASVSLGNPQQFAAGANKKVPKPPKPKDPSVIRLKTLLIPGLVPGRQIELDSENFDGSYLVSQVEYFGQTWSDAWHCQVVARAIKD